MSEEKETENKVETVQEAKEEPKKQKSLPEMLDLTPYRKEGEDFKEYKIRQKIQRDLLKLYKKGRLVWNPAGIAEIPITDDEGKTIVDAEGNTQMRKIQLGTYIKEMFGEIK